MLENSKRDPTYHHDQDSTGIARARGYPLFLGAEGGDLDGIDKTLQGELARATYWNCSMSLPATSAPSYSQRRIGTLNDALRLPLGLSVDELLSLAQRADGLYRVAKSIAKPDGSIRNTDALAPLKEIHRRLPINVNLHIPYLIKSLYPSQYMYLEPQPKHSLNVSNFQIQVQRCTTTIIFNCHFTTFNFFQPLF